MGACKRASLDKTEIKVGKKWRKSGDRREKWRTRSGADEVFPDCLTPGCTHRCQALNPGKNRLSR